MSVNNFYNSINLTHSVIIDCGQPVLSPNVSVVSTTGTIEGDTVTLQCEDGLYPVIPLMITCSNSGNWSPVSTKFVCMVISGKYITHTVRHAHTHIIILS